MVTAEGDKAEVICASCETGGAQAELKLCASNTSRMERGGKRPVVPIFRSFTFGQKNPQNPAATPGILNELFCCSTNVSPSQFYLSREFYLDISGSDNAIPGRLPLYYVYDTGVLAAMRSLLPKLNCNLNADVDIFAQINVRCQRADIKLVLTGIHNSSD